MIKLLCRRCHVLYIYAGLLYSICVDVLSPLTRGLPWSHLGHVVQPRAPRMATWQRCCEMSLCRCSQRQPVAAGPYPWWWETNGVTVKGQTTRLMNTVQNGCSHFKYEGNIFILCMILLIVLKCFCMCENNGSLKIIILIPVLKKVGWFCQHQRQA